MAGDKEKGKRTLKHLKIFDPELTETEKKIYRKLYTALQKAYNLYSVADILQLEMLIMDIIRVRRAYKVMGSGFVDDGTDIKPSPVLTYINKTQKEIRGMLRELALTRKERKKRKEVKEEDFATIISSVMEDEGEGDKGISEESKGQTEESDMVHREHNRTEA